MTDSVEAPGPHELAALEQEVAAALVSRELSKLTVIGFGEISMALGWPAAHPSWVAKRTPPLTEEQFGTYRSLVEDYLHQLRAAGVDVIDTTVTSVDGARSDGKRIGYLVQPLLEPETIGDQVLAAAAPAAEHPLLVAVANHIGAMTPRLSLDGQLTNWSWDGAKATLIDVGTPFMWNADGALRFDMTPYRPMVPAPVRGVLRRDMTALVAHWREPRGVALDLVANMLRVGLDRWIDPALATINPIVAPTDPITPSDAAAMFRQDAKTWPRVKRLQRLQRWWQTRVRRGSYDFFIPSAMGDRVY